MKAFVTGSTGFIGSHLVKDLLAHGYEVGVLARDVERARVVAGFFFAERVAARFAGAPLTFSRSTRAFPNPRIVRFPTPLSTSKLLIGLFTG